ncbi:MAG TPA: TIR domain-containing protein [Symbiobacteriaceae bacterium]|nr:TIR domain-containing protein [Symbiobacteriaceae bacterium]
MNIRRQGSRPSVFISYYHHRDQDYYSQFRHTFVERLQLVDDYSLQKPIDSDDPAYTLYRIGEEHIAYCDCLFVLCGAKTYQRPWIDWEIRLALDLGKAVVAVKLPGYQSAQLPSRLLDNLKSGYAMQVSWHLLVAYPPVIADVIARATSRPASLIRNERPIMRNRGDHWEWPLGEKYPYWTQISGAPGGCLCR